MPDIESTGAVDLRFFRSGTPPKPISVDRALNTTKN
jgi:hypothetical protein